MTLLKRQTYLTHTLANWELNRCCCSDMLTCTYPCWYLLRTYYDLQHHMWSLLLLPSHWECWHYNSSPSVRFQQEVLEGPGNDLLGINLILITQTITYAHKEAAHQGSWTNSTISCLPGRWCSGRGSRCRQGHGIQSRVGCSGGWGGQGVCVWISLLDNGCIVHGGAVPEVPLNIRPCSYIRHFIFFALHFWRYRLCFYVILTAHLCRSREPHNPTSSRRGRQPSQSIWSSSWWLEHHYQNLTKGLWRGYTIIQFCEAYSQKVKKKTGAVIGESSSFWWFWRPVQECWQCPQRVPPALHHSRPSGSPAVVQLL